MTISLISRGGAGAHLVSALLDYCTEEGGLPGYPKFIPGDNLHTHAVIHKKVDNFYISYLHPVSDMVMYANLHEKKPIIKKQIFDWNFISAADETLAPIANNDLGRLLILSMSIGKCWNKKLPPDDYFFDYSRCTSFGDKIEVVAFTLFDVLTCDFFKFHTHKYPTYFIDVLWFYNNEYEKIIETIIACGWTPKKEKVKIFCQKVLYFNKPYYDIISNCQSIYLEVINKIVRGINLTFFETAIIHALLMKSYNIESPKQIKLIKELPTSTEDFFNLYEVK